MGCLANCTFCGELIDANGSYYDHTCKKKDAGMKFEIGKFYMVNGLKHECLRITPQRNFCGEKMVDAEAWLMNDETGEVKKISSDFFSVIEWKEPTKKVMHAPALAKTIGGSWYITVICFPSAEDAKKELVHGFEKWPAYEANWPMLEIKE